MKTKECLLMPTSTLVRPWGVEPQSMEPESIILSIELWARDMIFSFSTIDFLVFSESKYYDAD